MLLKVLRRHPRTQKQEALNIDSLVWGFHGLGLCDATGGRVIKTINTKEADDED
jgi:hypothetical protein